MLAAQQDKQMRLGLRVCIRMAAERGGVRIANIPTDPVTQDLVVCHPVKEFRITADEMAAAYDDVKPLLAKTYKTLADLNYWEGVGGE